METPDEIHLSAALLESDLQTLFKLIVTHKQPVAEGDIRAAFAILRRWLLEGTIGKLAHKLGVKANFPVSDNSVVIEALLHAPDINYYLTAGVSLNGHPYMHIYDSNLPANAPRSLPIGEMPMSLVTVGNLLDQPRLYFRGEYFKCEEIIRFTANRLGGVHLDFRRKEREVALEAAGRYMTFGGPADRIETGTLGEIHLDVEPDSREALSALHLIVVSASSSLLQVHFDGMPVLSFKKTRSLVPRVRNALGFRRKPDAKLYERGQKMTDK